MCKDFIEFQFSLTGGNWVQLCPQIIDLTMKMSKKWWQLFLEIKFSYYQLEGSTWTRDKLNYFYLWGWEELFFLFLRCSIWTWCKTFEFLLFYFQMGFIINSTKKITPNLWSQILQKKSLNHNVTNLWMIIFFKEEEKCKLTQKFDNNLL
jgi:hypothetical protein